MASLDEAVLKRVLPHSMEAEQSVIGSMLMGREAIVAASEIIRGDDFYNKSYGVVFDAMVELNDQGQPVDAVTLQNRLKEKDVPPEIASLEFIRDLMTVVPTSANIRSYATIVSEKAVLRRLIRLTEEIANNCYAEKDGMEAILEDTEKRVFDLVQRRNTGDFTPIREVVMNAMDKIEKASHSNGNVTGIATGFIDLDYRTAGMQPSDLVLIAARPSMGKTAFVLNIAQYVAFHSGECVAIFSLEMSKEQLVNRLFAMESKVDSQHLRTGNLSDLEWEKLIESAGHDRPVQTDHRRHARHQHFGAALQMPEVQAGNGCEDGHHRLSSAHVGKRKGERIQAAGDFRYLPFPEGPGKRASGPGARAVPAEPRGGTEAGSQAHAFRSA